MGGYGAALVEKTETRARAEGRAEGREEGRQEGRKEGRVEGQNIMIESMLKSGKTPEQISTFCGIPIEQVRKVEESMLVTAE